MSINKSKTLVSKVQISPTYAVMLPMWVCSCDTCGKETRKPGANPGDTHENAWKEGWRPVPSGWYNQPMRWLCRVCFDNAKNKN